MNGFFRTLAFGGLAVGMAMTVDAAVQEGAFTAVVTSASDPGRLSFGRDPVTWVGKTVNGTFAYDVAMPGVMDVVPTAILIYAGGVDFVHATATIDGVEFAAQPVVGGTNVMADSLPLSDNTFGGGDWFSVQDSFARVGGRTVVGFDVFGPASLFSYTGSDGVVSFPFPTAGATGSGLIEDLYEPGGVVQRHGLIRFSLTSLTFGKSTVTLIADLLTAVTAVGPGSSLADKMAIVQAYYAAGDTAAACAEINAFENQITAQSGKKLTVAAGRGIARGGAGDRSQDRVRVGPAAIGHA